MLKAAPFSAAKTVSKAVPSQTNSVSFADASNSNTSYTHCLLCSLQCTQHQHQCTGHAGDTCSYCNTPLQRCI